MSRVHQPRSDDDKLDELELLIQEWADNYPELVKYPTIFASDLIMNARQLLGRK